MNCSFCDKRLKDGVLRVGEKCWNDLDSWPQSACNGVQVLWDVVFLCNLSEKSGHDSTVALMSIISSLTVQMIVMSMLVGKMGRFDTIGSNL